MAPFDVKVFLRTTGKMVLYVVAALLLGNIPFVNWALNALGVDREFQVAVMLPALAALRSVLVAGLRVNLGGLLGVSK